MPNSNSLIKAGYNSVAWILNQVCSVRTKYKNKKCLFDSSIAAFIKSALMA